MGKTFNTGTLVNGLSTDANGNVGIGISTPNSVISGAKVLQVNGSSYGFVLATSGTVIAQMIGDAGAGAAFGSRSNHHMTLTTNDVERLRITTSGNVGIGTSSPLALTNFTSLEVKGTNSGLVAVSSVNGAAFGRMYSSGGIVTIGTSSNHSVVFDTNDTERVRITNSGNVGIGTAAPEGPLHIYGNIPSGYVGIAIVNYGGGTNATAGIDFGTDGSSTYNGNGNGQITVVNTSVGDNRSEMNLKIWNGSALITGLKINNAGKVSFPTTTAMNYAVSNASAITVTNNCSPTTVASITITTSGKPVLLAVSGDNNPLGGSSWCYVMIFRNGSAVGKRVICESPSSSSNVPFALTHIDMPSAGTYTYTVAVSVCGGYPIIFGETGDVQAPTITAVELL